MSTTLIRILGQSLMKELVYNKVVGFHICKNVTSPHALFKDYAYCL